MALRDGLFLGDNMKNQIINVYEYLNIQEKLDIDFVIAEGFISDELNEHVKNEMIEKKVATFGNSLNIGYMSNLIEDKGIIIFIEAIIYIKEVLGHDIRAWIAGDYIGTPSKSRECYEKVKTKNYINYVGVIRDKQKWDKLLETDLFILPTYYKTEALPLSIVEAMRCGCLCISSKIVKLMNC